MYFINKTLGNTHGRIISMLKISIEILKDQRIDIKLVPEVHLVKKLIGYNYSKHHEVFKS